jgi:ADP-ribose pyrophosphatase YjhB (NUDIX family)
LGESLEEAVRREVLEEVGLEVTVGDLVVALDRVIRDPAGKVEYHYILLDFYCESLRGEPSAGGDALSCAFVPVDALSIHPLTRGTEEVIHRAFARIQGITCPTYQAAL